MSAKLENEYRLKIAEKDQHLESMSQKIEDLQKKANLTSQQLQGEVLETDVQRVLVDAFPDDEITEVAKFKNGSDVKQLVKSGNGRLCGKILWECKRTNVFKLEFITKLKEDLLREEANFGIIVTTSLPKSAVSGIARIDGIWICSQTFIGSLGSILRESLINLAKEKWINENKGNKGDLLIAYFSSIQFTQQVGEHVEALQAQREQISKERTVYAKMWADRELQIDRQTRSIAKIMSSIQGYVGAGMQNIEAFDLLALKEGKT